jgi:hypothetical protein
LWDVLQAVERTRIARFADHKSFLDDETDGFLRSAVERQLEIVGEPMNQWARVDPDLAATIPGLRPGTRRLVAVDALARLDKSGGRIAGVDDAAPVLQSCPADHGPAFQVLQFPSAQNAVVPVRFWLEVAFMT